MIHGRPTSQLLVKYYLRMSALVFKSLILEGGVVVDIGAHIDWHTRNDDGPACKENIGVEPT
jgi:hypothetical protein